MRSSGNSYRFTSALSATVIATALNWASAPAFGQSTAGTGWRVVGALRQAKGTETTRVKVLSASRNSVRLTYSMPPATAHRLGTERDRVVLGNAPLTGEPGLPRLPVVPARVLIPVGCEVDSIRVSCGQRVALDGAHAVEYAEKPYALEPNAVAKPAVPDATVYGSDAPYPAAPYTVVGVQKKRGASILLLNLNPVEYRPASGQLSYLEDMTVDVTFRAATRAGAVKCRRDAARALTDWVDNPDTAATYDAPTLLDDGAGTLGWCNPTGHFEYVVITSEGMKNAQTDYSLTNLVAQRQAQGISATLVTVESIYTNYTGVDNAEKVRNFIIDAYNNWETEYVLLAGDTGVVPMRKLYCVASGYTDDIPSDLYYQCLDGNFNSDGDSSWGETTDGTGGADVDLMAEVYVGRASAENTNEMANFVYKTLAYENAPDTSDYLRRALMCGEYLGFGGISDYATASMEEIHWGANTNGYATEGFASCGLFEVDTLYDSDSYSWAKSNIVQSINSGSYSIINHLGHANYNYVMKFYNADADSLTNRNVMFAYSQGCIPGNFEADCVAEHLTTSTRFGMYAVVFNARYGWGRYSSTDGPSQRFDRQFWDAYFNERIIELGAINADSHEDNLYDINGSCIRWCYYESNLLGDPRTPMRGQFLADALAVTPSAGLASSGGVGGPYSPSSKTYTIYNTSTNLALQWAATCSSNWVTLTPTGGTVAAGSYTSFVASINANASLLGEARYAASVVFTNRTNGKGSTVRGIDLLVNNPPRLTNSSIQAGSVLPSGSLTYTAQFNDRIKASTLDSSDFALRGTATGAKSPAWWSFNTNTATLTLNYSALPEDEYTLTLYSGDGRFEDAEGLNLDGEATAWPIPPNVSGDGTEGGDFSFAFALDASTVAYPVPFVAKKPYGSLIYDPSASASIRPAGDTDRFTFSADTNQTITVMVDPTDATLQVRVDLFNPSGAKIGSVTGATVGACAVLQTVAVGAEGTYAFEVGGMGVTTGRYSAQVVLNAALESESYDGAANNTLATAQNLSNSFVGLVGTAARAAVVGRTEAGQSDYYSVDLRSNDLVTLAVTSLRGDAPTVEVYNAGGALVASGRSGLENVSQAVENYRVPSAGRYSARVTGVGGDYSLVILRNTGFDLESNSTFTNAQDISGASILLGAVAASAPAVTNETEPNDDGLVGGTTNDLAAANDFSGSFVLVTGMTYQAKIGGTIASGSDVDWDFYKIYAGPGDSVSIRMNGSTLGDSYLRLFDRSAVQLAYDDDSGGNLNSLLVYTNFQYRGEYYIVADSYGTGVGAYTVTASLTTAYSPVRTDDDYVKLTALAGDSLVIQTTTPGDGANEFVNALDPALELLSPSGATLASDDNSAPDLRNALIRYNVASGGVYVVRVRSAAGTGEYTVSLPRKLGPLQVLFRDPESMAFENAGPVFLPVILTAATSAAVQVSYSVVGGTASSGVDYVLAAGTLVVQPGQIATGITVAIANDSLDEGTETFRVKLSNPVNAQLGEYQTNRCVIVDDERPVRLQFESAFQQVPETATSAVLRVVRTGGSDGQVSVLYATRDGSATGDEDFKSLSGTVTFPDGWVTGSVTVPVELDTLDEVDESFTVELSGPAGGAILAAPGTATVQILDFKMSRSNMLANADFETGISNGWRGVGQVGWSSWASLAGTSGVYIAGWNGYSYGAISQQVNATRGTYTFSLWAKREEGYNQREALMRLEWLDALGNPIRAPTVANYTNFPGDGQWHQMFVTGKCTNSNMSAVRGVFYSAFDIKVSDRCSMMVDSAALYPGVYTGVCQLANAGFENGDANEWRGSAWYALPERVANGRESWAGNSAAWGAALYGWDAMSNEYTTVLGQNLTPGNGTHTFSVWIKREANFLLSSLALRLQWYDATFTNKVQADSVADCAVPADSGWHAYNVTGSCTATNLFEVRAVVCAQYLRNSNEVPYRALMIDDGLFYKGALDTDRDGMPDDWESTYFTNSCDARPDGDADGDGRNNYQEYLADTNPTNLCSCFDATLGSDASGNDVAFYGSAERVYTLQFSTNLLPSPSWHTIRTGIRGGGGPMHVHDSSGAGGGYYRLRVDLP